jgi:hypothetical protein
MASTSPTHYYPSLRRLCLTGITLMTISLPRPFPVSLTSLLASCLVVLFQPTAATAFQSAAEDLYVKSVRPLLRAHCVACHGALRQEAGLRLDTAVLIRRGGTTGAAVTAGDAASSLLLQRITASDVSQRMPPEDSGEALSAEQIEHLRSWINSGAAGPADEQAEADPREHWSFRPVQRPAISLTEPSAAVDPIEFLLQSKRSERGLEPLPEAPRELLLRRLTFALTGLPPTAEELAAVRQDPRDDWYEQAVDRLLADSRYGERWARHWMDVWRYSDWWGLGDQLRNSQKHIWHWRDWIVQSLNEDLAYDEMVRLMLAADESHPNSPAHLRATGFLARNYFLFNRPQWMDETVEHVGKAFLGLTMNCARCHDHKYDPIEQQDYYRMRAFFEPYHARLDVIAGESDLERNGIPRVFDAFPETPTWLYVRGDEKRPDKSTAIAPGVPSLFEFSPLQIKPVRLPVEAWEPQRREWVGAAYAAAAEQKLRSAESALASARQVFETARTAPRQLRLTAPENQPELTIIDNFQTLDATRWKLVGGDWQHGPGLLRQRNSGMTRAVLRLQSAVPRDFEAIVRFTIEGGTQYRSVGLSFDASPGDPLQDSVADYHEQNVYVSAQSPGSKIHAAWNSGGRWNYPPGAAMRNLPIEVGREYTLRLQVRDRIINASLNGIPVLACSSPVERRSGVLQLTTFDAAVVVHEFQFAALAETVPLHAAGSLPAEVSLSAVDPELAAIELAAAEAAVQVAAANLSEVRSRWNAWQAIWKESPADVCTAAHASAIEARRTAAIAQAKLDLAAARREHYKSAADRKSAAAAAVGAAEAAVKSAEAALATPIPPAEPLPEFVGARWTATRFLSSGTDDPAPKFLAESTGRRTALAEWITDRRNPLTARVAVNHIWMRLLGQPLVPSVFDFGRKTAAPVHSELLDWLAAEFMEGGWSMKRLQRRIVLSAAFRRSSQLPAGDARLAADPENEFYWRRVPVRMESQVVRDSLLAFAGTLDSTQGGPAVPMSEQAGSRRRSLYFQHSNNDRNLFLTMFDDALVTDCYRREQSIVPQQALALSNSRLVLENAPLIAERIAASMPVLAASTDDAAFVRAAFRWLLAQEPDADETAACERALVAWRQLPEAMQQGDPAAFARTRLTEVLLNHHDLITIH